jgi:uncharacterized membrane protein YedE/YeeE
VATRQRIAGLAVGLAFGVTLSWSGMTSPDVIRGALLLEQSYLFLFFASAVATATVGVALLKRYERRALLVDAPIACKPEAPKRRHVAGALLFGVGWGVSNSCPGPIATQIGGGSGWAIITLVGVFGGIWLYLRREAVEHEPATDPVPASASPQPAMTAA